VTHLRLRPDGRVEASFIAASMTRVIGVQTGKQLWQEARSKFPGDYVAAWFDEHIVHRIDSTPDTEEAVQDVALVERVRTICVDAAQMFPDDREAAIEWALDRWEGDVGSLGNRDDPEVRNVMRSCLDLAYSGKWGKEAADWGALARCGIWILCPLSLCCVASHQYAPTMERLSISPQPTRAECPP